MQNILIQNYLVFRNAIGIIGLATPIALILFSGIFTAGDYWVQPSISHYYYSVMHFLFMFILILLGSFLIFYKGNGKVRFEDFISTLAGFSAYVVAIFPTKYEGFNGLPFLKVYQWKDWHNTAHFSAAGILFVCFAIMCLTTFQKSDHQLHTPEQEMKKKRRNLIYRICGFIIVASIGLIGLFSFALKDWAEENFSNYVYVFEWTALWAFGLSWLVKGSELFKNFAITKMIR
jgi:hypothetical protein